MAAPIIQGDYDGLVEIIKIFVQHVEQTKQLQQEIKQLVGQLADGGWVGLGAANFFAEMDDLIFPAMGRAGDAFGTAGESTQRIGALFEEAENEAGRLFSGAGMMAAFAGASGVLAGGTAGGSGGSLIDQAMAKVSSLYDSAKQLFNDTFGLQSEYFQDGGPVPDSHWARNTAYKQIMEEVAGLPGEAGKVKFFGAAERVTSLSRLAGAPVANFITKATDGINSLLGLSPENSISPLMSDTSKDFIEEVGADLFKFNRGQAAKLIANPSVLMDPNGTGRVMNSALEYDLNYVHAEQSQVEKSLREAQASGRLNSGHLGEITDSINGGSDNSYFRSAFYSTANAGVSVVDYAAKGVNYVAGTNFQSDIQASDWAKSFAGGNLDFTQQNHREAIGKAMVFQEHGFSQQQYLNYMRTGQMP
jgi:WXG100 family type VII secretion target